MKTTLLREIISRIVARENCRKSNNTEWLQKHGEALAILQTELPSGSGIDCGTKIDCDDSTRNKLILNCSYHHMNESGMYDGWTEHRITVTPDLLHGFNISISGRNRNEIKEYLHETYSFALAEEIDTEKMFVSAA